LKNKTQTKAELRAEIERLEELLRGVGANRYWERRWRDPAKKIDELEFRLLASQDATVHQ
jgi:hypothetical protein